MSKRDKLIIFDTTLRDGEQSPGASMTRDEKVRIAKALERMRVDVIEARFPIASPGDFEAVQAVARTVKDSTVCGLAGLVAPAFGWRACFFALGVAGLVAAVAVGWLPDPAGRQAPAREAVRSRAGAEVARELAALLRGAPALPLLMLGGALMTFAAASGIHWITWLVQERAFTFRRAAFLAGVIYAVAGLCGNVLGGWFADWCASRWRGGRIWSMVVTALGQLPCGLLFLFSPPGSAAFYAGWFLTSLGSTTWYGPLFATAQDIAPARIRSTTVAFLMLVINVLGVGLGPWITGLIGDRASLTRGILVSLLVGACSVVPLAIAARRYQRDWDRVNPRAA